MAKRFGVMLDFSRNAVMKPEEVKSYASLLRDMGYNMIMLYTEDTYEIPEEPYFGYLRGRYSIDELISISKYCNSIGMEVIPAIQTLAHLERIYKWGAFRPICDKEGILLADDERTYELIRNMFSACRKAYPYTKVINIGMDEAFGLGLGAYLKKHGFTAETEIFFKHLDRVIEIAKEFDFEPIMWSDMFFRMEHGGEYEMLERPEDMILSEDAIARAPKGVSQVFWRYHSANKAGYTAMLKEHKRFPGESWFAGGAWTWKGFVGSNFGSIERMTPALLACREEGVENIVITTWGNDGTPCSYWSIIPSLYAMIRTYEGETDMTAIKEGFEKITGEPYDDMMMLDLPADWGNNSKINTTPHNIALYNDAFLGFFDTALPQKYVENYKELAPVLETLADKGGRFAYLYTNMANLCKALSIKYDLGARTRKAYLDKDSSALQSLVSEYLDAASMVEAFCDSMRNIWYKENKPFGFEPQEHRLGGLAYRLRSLSKRLDSYIKLEIPSIPELETEILPYFGDARPQAVGEGLPHLEGWRNMVTVNRI